MQKKICKICNQELAMEEFRTRIDKGVESKRKECYQCEYKRNKTWFKTHPEERKRIQRECKRRERQTIRGKLNHRMNTAILNALKSLKGGRSWESLVGYTVEDLKCHLESKFKNGMTWKKLMAGKIHIDHIRPKVLYEFLSYEDEEFKKCWSLNNLQPLWAEENLRKGDSYEG